jgi:hypothetical protein
MEFNSAFKGLMRDGYDTNDEYVNAVCIRRTFA